MINEKINVDDLNGVGETTLKIITKTIQDANPVKFSQACEDFFKTANQETIVNYSINNYLQQTNQGQILIYVCNIQYWVNENEFKAYLEELKRSSLILKP